MKTTVQVSRLLPMLAVGAICTAGLDSEAIGKDGKGFVAIPVLNPTAPTGSVAGAAGCTYAVDDGSGEQNVGFGAAGMQGIANTLVIDPSCPTIDTIQVAWGTMNTSIGTNCTVSIYDDPNNDGDPSDAVLLASAVGITANEGTDTYNDYALGMEVSVSGLFFIAAVAEVAGTDPNGDGSTSDGDFCMRNDRTTLPSNGVSWFLGNVGDGTNVFNSGGTVGINGAFGAGFDGNLMIRATGPGAPPNCPTDIIPADGGNGATDVDDLVAVILAWGPCPIKNESCESAIFSLTGDGTVFLGEISCDPVSLSFNNTGADNDGGAFECDETAGADVWYEATFNCTGFAVIDTNGSDFDTVLEVYGVGASAGDDCANLVLLGCDNDSGDDGLDSRLELAVEPGTSLKIRVGGGALGPEGAGVLNLCCAESLPDPPANDDCSNATPLAVDGSDSQQTITASEDPEAFPCGQTVDAPGAWYSVTGTGNTMTCSLCTDTDYDAKIFVYCAGEGGDPCVDLACVTGDDDGCGDVGGPSEASWCSEADREYLIYVSGFGGATGNFTITLSDDAVGCGTPDPCIPNEMLANDECIDAIPITNGLTEYSTLSASSSESPAHPADCSTGGDGGVTVHDIWFTYTVDCPSDTGLLSVSTCEDVGASADYDSDIVIYDAASGLEVACGDLAAALLGCSDDNCPIGAPADPWHSHAELPVSNGQELIIRIGGWGTEGGDLGTGMVLIDCVNADNDLCNFATPVDQGGTAGVIELQLDMCGATVDDLAPICGSSAADKPGRWLSLAGTGDNYTVTLCNLSNPSAKMGMFVDTRLNVYCAGFGEADCTALECAAEEPVDNGDCPFTESLTFCTSPGFAYLILVQAGDDFGSGCEGTVDVTITTGAACSVPPCVEIGACCIDNGADCMDFLIDLACAEMGGDFYADIECADIECFVPCEPGTSDTTIQQHYSDEPITGAVRCQSGGTQTDNWFYREFLASDLADPEIPDGASNVLPASLYVCSVEVAIEDAIDNGVDGFTPMGIALYDVALGSLTFDANGNTTNTPVLSRTFNIFDSDMFTIKEFEIGGQVSSGVLTMEVFTPSGLNTDDNAGSILQLGDNSPGNDGCPPTDCGQSSFSYIRSPPCGLNAPATFDSIGFVGASFIWKLNGITN